MKILLAVDGSKPSLAAVSTLVQHVGEFRIRPEIELITVHLPVPKLPRMGMAVGKSQLAKYYADEGEAILTPAMKKLDAARLTYTPRVLIGPVAETIVKHAKSARCDMICMGSRGMGQVGAALVGSTASRILHLASIPLLIVK